METGDHSRELETIAAKLRTIKTNVSVRGSDRALFIYAQRGQRGLELSREDTGYWLEFWDGDSQVSELTLLSADEAVQAGQKWLNEAVDCT